MKSPLFFSLNEKSYVAGFPQISFNPVTHEIASVFQFEQKIICRRVPANQLQPGYTWNHRYFSVWTKNHVSPGSSKSVSTRLHMKLTLFFSLNKKSCVAGFPQINFTSVTNEIASVFQFERKIMCRRVPANQFLNNRRCKRYLSNRKERDGFAKCANRNDLLVPYGKRLCPLRWIFSNHKERHDEIKSKWPNQPDKSVFLKS